MATAAVTAGGEPPLALEALEVSKTFGGVRALEGVAFALRRGEIHCLAGENGSGKSTLIKIVSGVHAPEPGAVIRFDGRAQPHLTPALARRLGVQVIWQDLALFPHLTVGENIAFEANLGGRPRLVRYSALRAAARAVMERLGFALDLGRTVRELGIAQRQLVAICRALVAEARIVFMDEPTASLTRTETEALFQVVRRLSADGIAVVFVSHRLQEVMAIAERVTVLRDGRLVGVYPTDAISARRLGELMTGQLLDDEIHAADRDAAPVVLETRALARRGEYAHVSLQVRAGEVVGLIGLLGAGRTELASSLFGLTRPDAGEVLVDGRPVRFGSTRDAIRAGIAYVPEDRLALGLIAAQSIADNGVITVLDRIRSAIGLLSERRKRGLVAEWVRRLAIRIRRPDDAVATLSGGNQQRVVLAKWLATAPRLLILDSPTVGVDVGARAGIFAIIRELAAAGKAILLISDEVPEVYHNADRVLHMRGGRIVGSFDPRTASIEAIERAVHA